jgi:hypothetical protein
VSRECYGLCGVVGTGPGDDWNPAFYLIHRYLNYALVLSVREGGRLAGGTTRHHTMDTVLEMKLD